MPLDHNSLLLGVWHDCAVTKHTIGLKLKCGLTLMVELINHTSNYKISHMPGFHIDGHKFVARYHCSEFQISVRLRKPKAPRLDSPNFLYCICILEVESTCDSILATAETILYPVPLLLLSKIHTIMHFLETSSTIWTPSVSHSAIWIAPGNPQCNISCSREHKMQIKLY